jgi:hypothetical protein
MTKIAKTIEKTLNIKSENYKTIFCRDFIDGIITSFQLYHPSGFCCWEDAFSEEMSDGEIIDNINNLRFNLLDRHVIPENHHDTVRDIIVQAFKAYKEGRIMAGKFILASVNIWLLDYENKKVK